MSTRARRIYLTYTEVQVPLFQRTMEYDKAPVLALLLLGEPYGHPHPPTEMLLPFVQWPYCTPSPDTPPYGLLPNMSESSGTPGENRARGSLASVFP